VEVSGGKQIATVGSALPQPVIVQVNGADGNPVTGALVTFRGEGLQFTPAQALSDASGQVSTSAQLGFNAGDYQITAETPKKDGGAASRVSNFDNLSPSPHQFSDGATYNRLSDADVINFISHGGPAVGKSPQMPAYGVTLKPAEIKALLDYIRSIADPPYQSPGVKYGK
jgi:hypothetical protein